MRVLEPESPTPTAERILLTPKLAAEILEKNTSNRKIVQQHVDNLGRDMLAGAFAFSNDAVCTGPDGVLYNGQHRCWAVVQTGVSIWVLLVRNMDPGSRGYIDIGGEGRKPGDTERILTGDITMPSRFELANAMRTIVTRTYSATKSERKDFVGRHEKGISWALSAFGSSRTGLSILSVRAGFAFAYETSPEKIAEFQQRYLTGVGEFDAGDPALALHRSIQHTKKLAGQHRRRAMSLKTLRACLAYLKGEKLNTLLATEDVAAFFGRRFGYTMKVTESQRTLRRLPEVLGD